MTIKCIWLIFSVMFLFLCIFHFRLAMKKLPKFEFKGVVKQVSGLNLGISEFSKDFSIYIDELNKSNKEANLGASIGYFVALLTSVFSLYLS